MLQYRRIFLAKYLRVTNFGKRQGDIYMRTTNLISLLNGDVGPWIVMGIE